MFQDSTRASSLWNPTLLYMEGSPSIRFTFWLVLDSIQVTFRWFCWVLLTLTLPLVRGKTWSQTLQVLTAHGVLSCYVWNVTHVLHLCFVLLLCFDWFWIHTTVISFILLVFCSFGNSDRWEKADVCHVLEEDFWSVGRSCNGTLLHVDGVRCRRCASLLLGWVIPTTRVVLLFLLTIWATGRNK